MADVQTGFGSFVSFYLADQGWSEEKVGFVLTAGGLSGVVARFKGCASRRDAIQAAAHCSWNTDDRRDRSAAGVVAQFPGRIRR
jgi:hypothetical protein